jgi:hypothetical protein
MTAVRHFPGFEYPSYQILKYISLLNNFTIMLNSGEIVKFTPSNELAFLNWLTENGIPSIRNEEGWVTS